MKQRRGFALLLVFVMAAAIAITLYNELPRVAFEAQRNKEQMLIERGEQYVRAIQLYVRKVKSYPTTIEQLESTNQVRFLRKRYNDPMTGKSEWRIVHIGAGGVYTDSLVHKAPAAKEEQKSVNTFTYEAPVIGSTIQAGQTDPGFPQLRPSERVGMRMPGQPPQPGDPVDPQPGAQPQSPSSGQPQPLTGLPPLPGFPAGVVVPPGAFTPQGVNPQQPGQQPPVPPPNQPGAQPGSPLAPGPPGQNQALALINQILTSPRAAVQPGTSQPQGMQIGAGSIAGIASTVERSGIKIYNEMEKYNEWEFLYDPTKDRSGLVGGQPVMGGQQQGLGQGRGGQPPPQQAPPGRGGR